jgi:predicted ATPase/class 3 adenylate cyclase
VFPGDATFRASSSPREGEVQLERYFRDRRATDLSSVHSVTKSVVATLAGIAIGDGLLSIETTLGDIFGSDLVQEDERKRDISVEQLLSMTAGLNADSPHDIDEIADLLCWPERCNTLHMRRDLPTGTVTFLFTDIEGSTNLLENLGAAVYAEALGEHRRIIREAASLYGGVEVDTQGDAFFLAFPTAPGALEAARSIAQGLSSSHVRVRVGLHTGTPFVTDEGYVGTDVHQAARIAAAGHGGQILISSATQALLPKNALRDLGEHRLKDLSAPERIYQLGDADFPPLKTLHQTNLPIPQTPFLGRERELDEVTELLGRDDVRLLTLTGPGGTGKTRLGVQAAGAIAERYPHGVFWVPLATLRDPELVLENAAHVVGANDGLASHISDKRMLLLFDNFEHVVDAASGLSTLLGECPHLELLVTSREPLHLEGEQEYAVPPLTDAEAVDFFVFRARAVTADFEVDEAVPEICRRLDALPLALELAAARVKALSTAQILSRLEQRLPLLRAVRRDAPERQRTLKATIEWSYDLLSSPEQELFRQLSVFVGGCTLEAAEDVCEADLDTLQSLVDKSLLRFSFERYWMLETIREYAAERLSQDDNGDALRQRHLAFFSALADWAQPRLDRREVLATLGTDEANLRAALTYAKEHDPPGMLRLAGSLWRFWYARRQHVEGRGWVEQALRLNTSPSRDRAHALRGLSSFLIMGREDVPLGRELLEEAIGLYRRFGDYEGLWRCTHNLGVALIISAQEGLEPETAYDRAAELFEEAIRTGARFRGTGLSAATSMGALADIALVRGNLMKARRLSEEQRDVARADGDDWGMVDAEVRLAWIEALEGSWDRAATLVRAALAFYAAIGREWPGALGLAAAVAARRGRRIDAARVLGALEVHRLRPGIASWGEPYVPVMEALERELGGGALAHAREEGSRLSLHEAYELAMSSVE